MGAWSCTVLGSDNALDMLDEIKDSLFNELEKEGFIHENKEDYEDFSFYPLESIENEDLNELQYKVRELFEKWVLDKNSTLYGTLDENWYLVVSSIAMSYGIEMPQHLKDFALADAEGDEWAEESDERKDYMNAFIDAINRYETGKPLLEPTEGLFDKLYNASSSDVVKKALAWKEKDDL